MSLGQRNGANDSIGIAFWPLGVALGQISEVGFSRLNLQIKLTGKKAVLKPKQAVHHLIQLVLAFKESSLSLWCKAITHERASPDVLAKTFKQVVFSNLQLLQELGPLLQLLITALLQQLQTRSIQIFIGDNDLSKGLLHQHLLNQRPQQVVLLQQGQAF